MSCVCVQHADGSVTTSHCPLHADTDPCLSMSWTTGRRRKGTIRRGVCTSCGWTAKRIEAPGMSAPHCPRCRRELRSWPLRRPNRCAPPDWRYCIREVPGVVAPE